MKMKTNYVAPANDQAGASVKNNVVGRALFWGGVATMGGGILVACKGPAEVQTAPKKPVPAVNYDVANYEIKVGLGGARVGGTSTAADSASQVGILINNTSKRKNEDNYYFVPSKSVATALYGKTYWSAPLSTATSEFAIGNIGLFGKNDTVNVGIVTSKQLLEFLANAIVPEVSGGSVRLVNDTTRKMFVKEHDGLATQDDYIINRNRYGLAGVWENVKDSAYALWVIPEMKKTYSIKVPFKMVPQNDAAISLKSNLFAYRSDGRRQIEIAITEEKPMAPEASVKDFKVLSKPTGGAGYSDMQAIVYTTTDAMYVQDTVMKYSIGDTVFRKARGDMAVALGTVGLDTCAISNKLGRPGRAGTQVIVTPTGVLATYYRLKAGDAKDTTGIAAVQVPLTKYANGLEVIESCNKKAGRVFDPVLGTGLNLFSFLTKVPGEKDTMQLRILRQNDGDIISLKMGMAGVSKITHNEKNDGIHVDVYGADNKIIGTVIIAKGVPYQPIRKENKILEDKATSYIRTGKLDVPKVAEMPYVPKEHIMYLLADKYLPNGQVRTNRSRFSDRSI